MYTMKETCAQPGLPYETLKFYCNQGLIPNVKRDSKNHKVFDDRDIALLPCDRPCSGEVDQAKEEELMNRCAAAIKSHYGYDVIYNSGSTDCNIPLSLGVPSVCVGCVEGAGAHTREEYVEISSLKPGLGVAFELILYHF